MFEPTGNAPAEGLAGLLKQRAAAIPDATAILGAARAELTYAGLWRQVSETGAALKGLGIGKGDRVAMVLANGPEMAAAFLAVAACATAAPLNPGYQAEEFEFYLSDLDAKALLVRQGAETPAVAVARARGIRVVEIQPEAAGGGRFTIPCERRGEPEFGAGGEVALILHTSGTTSRPKMAPLTHRNLLASARSVAASLELTGADRCLNVMPLFHIHGLMAALLASLWAGGSVACTPGLQAPAFFDWVKEFAPTWYTAVPTMHQSILRQAEKNPEAARGARLRFIRSCSAALPPQVMREMEAAFGAPVIEAYGMTEAAHQMTSNPLPPRERKPGSVGVAAGPEVAVMDPEGALLPAGVTGEVVIRGENVTPGYLNNPAANEAGFTNGWFRTGDQGVLDADGYLRLTGRLKEIVNRGGEKISPREVDEAILDHPDVAQALAFAVPDARLGEDLAVAVVLKPGRTATARSIQEFAASRLADFKVPQTVVFLEEIPKGPTGKLQRIGLAERLGIRGRAERAAGEAAPFEEPGSETERTLAAVWAEVLKVERIGRNDDFLELGGDSVLAAQVAARLRDRLGVEMTLAAFFGAPELRDQAAAIESLLASPPESGP